MEPQDGARRICFPDPQPNGRWGWGMRASGGWRRRADNLERNDNRLLKWVTMGPESLNTRKTTSLLLSILWGGCPQISVSNVDASAFCVGTPVAGTCAQPFFAAAAACVQSGHPIIVQNYYPIAGNVY